jgi:hypothetical protein
MSKSATAIETLPSPAELAKMGFENNSSKPVIMKMKDMKVSDVIDGVLKKITPSTNPEKIRQPLLEMELTKDKTTILVPCQGGIGVKLFSTPEEKAQLKSRFIGKRILIAKTGFKRSDTYNDASGQGTEFATYDVIEYTGK